MTPNSGLPQSRPIHIFDSDALCLACPLGEMNLCDSVKRPADRQQVPTQTLPSAKKVVRARHQIIRDGEMLESVPVVCEGWAAAGSSGPRSRQQILTFLLPGDVFASSLFLDPASPVRIEAVTDVTYRTFNRTELKNALLKHPVFFKTLLLVLTREVGRANEMLADLGYCTAEERIARLIVRLSERLTRIGLARNGVFDFALRQHHIADATGLTPVHVNKVLSSMKRAGAIAIENNSRSLAILDMAQLKRFANL